MSIRKSSDNLRQKRRVMNSILITGCSRGLGLGLIKELLDSKPPIKHIFATCRQPDKAKVTSCYRVIVIFLMIFHKSDEVSIKI